VVAQAERRVAPLTQNHGRVKAVEVVDNPRAEALEEREDHTDVAGGLREAAGLGQLAMVVDLTVDGADPVGELMGLVTVRCVPIDRQPGEPERNVPLHPSARVIWPSVPHTAEAV